MAFPGPTRAAAHRPLRARGVAVFAEPFVIEPIGQRLSMVKDNSGNIIELAQAVGT